MGRVAGQLGLKSSRPLSQVSPGPTQSESTQPGVFLEHSVTYMYMIYGLGFCIIFRTKSKINIKKILTNIAIKLLIDRALCQALTDRFPISCKQGNYRFLNIELARTSWRLYSLCFTSSFPYMPL